MTKTCIICGSPFEAAPSSKTVTCSPACRSVRAARAARSSPRKWSEEARQRRAGDPDILEAMSKLQPIGAAAALSLPEGQRGPQHRTSKVWVLVDPTGQHIEVKNLRDWARANYALFEPDVSDPDKAAARICAGIGAIASSMRGVRSRKRPVSTYKGWGLYALPTKEDHHDR